MTTFAEQAQSELFSVDEIVTQSLEFYDNVIVPRIALPTSTHVSCLVTSDTQHASPLPQLTHSRCELSRHLRVGFARRLFEKSLRTRFAQNFHNTENNTLELEPSSLASFVLDTVDFGLVVIE